MGFIIGFAALSLAFIIGLVVSSPTIGSNKLEQAYEVCGNNQGLRMVGGNHAGILGVSCNNGATFTIRGEEK